MHNLDSLRILGSTGMTLKENNYMTFFETFGKGRLPIMNICGGTELLGCLTSPLPNMPQKVSSVGAQGLGMDVAFVDEDGREVAPGVEGLLVCRNIFPSMTRSFLGKGGDKYFLDTYFSRFPGVWYHHDRGYADSDGYFYITGRADDMIVKNGVNIDPENVDEALRSFTEPTRIKNTVTIGVPDEETGARIVSFIVLDAGVPATLIPKLKELVRTHVGKEYNPHARPDEVYFVESLPRTLTGKIPRKRYVAAYLGEDLGDLSSITDAHIFSKISDYADRNRGT